ncbi:MAG: MBL fold metallo-hydrolase [Christensenellales bacterium]|jgi:phosphoribosyl 1,2-cyclic phosphodiesterase
MIFCPLFSGSSGNASYIAAGDTALLLDAGMSARMIVSALKQIGADPSGLKGILVTHEHTDHSKGVGTLSRKFDIPVYANAKTFEAMEKKIGPIAGKNIRIFNTNQDFYIRDIGVYPCEIPHDAADPVGFCFYAGGHKVSVMTDLGYVTGKVFDAAARSDVLMLEANHDVEMLQNGPYPGYLKKRILGRRGHLSNELAGKTLAAFCKAGVGRIFLGHLSEKNNTEQLAYQTVASILHQQGIRDELTIKVARRTPSAYVCVR